MKTTNKILKILVIVFALASVVLFFTKFATVSFSKGDFGGVGAQFAFGSEIKVGDATFDLARSGHILFCFWLTVITFVLSIFSAKSKKVRYCVPALALIDAVYMFVIRFGGSFIDVRPIAGAQIVKAPTMLILPIVLAVLAVLSIAYLLVDDYIEVLASKGEKLTIPKRIGRFFRDYKSEIKKIVWPTFKDVLKNTFIVLVMCLLVGALIWLVDYGLGNLIDWILSAGK